jgi:hypothetical protein
MELPNGNLWLGAKFWTFQEVAGGEKPLVGVVFRQIV